MCSVGLQEILKAMCRFVELRAVSSYLIAVVAIMKRCRDRHFRISTCQLVNATFLLAKKYAASDVCCVVSV